MVCPDCHYQARDQEGYPYCTKYHNRWLHPTRDTQTACAIWVEIKEVEQ